MGGSELQLGTWLVRQLAAPGGPAAPRTLHARLSALQRPAGARVLMSAPVISEEGYFALMRVSFTASEGGLSPHVRFPAVLGDYLDQ